MENVKIRAKSTIKLVAPSGMQLSYEYSKGCKIEKMLEDVLFAEFKNKGSDSLKKFCNNMIDEFSTQENKKSA